MDDDDVLNRFLSELIIDEFSRHSVGWAVLGESKTAASCSEGSHQKPGPECRGMIQ